MNSTETETKSGTVKKSVSFEKDLLDKGLERAGKLNRNWSNYLQDLVNKDLEKAKQETAK